MVKRLVVMRHAKSSWKHEGLSDHERPLNKRGRHDAPRIAGELERLGWMPQFVLSSNSVRTQETWGIMQQEFSECIHVKWLESFYHGGLRDVAEELGQMDDAIPTLLLLGHNPGWEDLVAELSGQDLRMPTACAVLLEKDCSWSDAFQGEAWTVVSVLKPKEL